MWPILALSFSLALSLSPSTSPLPFSYEPGSYDPAFVLLTTAPFDKKWQTSIGNGYMSTFLDSDAVYLAGVFNGNQTVSTSHRARVPSSVSLSFSSPFSVSLTALDLLQGTFFRRWSSSDSSTVQIEEVVFAHQLHRSVIVHEVLVTRQTTGTPVDIPITSLMGRKSEDISFSGVDVSFYLPPYVTSNSLTATFGTTYVSEENWTPLVQVSHVYTSIPSSLSLSTDETAKSYLFITVCRTSLDSADPVADAVTDYVTALNSKRVLFQEHALAWKRIWESRIEIGGDLDLAQKVSSSLYYILSSVRDDFPHGLSPGSLASNAYNGHSFWDTETWMLPPLQILHPQLVRSLIQYRFDRRGAAARFAKFLSADYEGTAFPWETGAFGNDVCPLGYGTCTLEQHISGDIAFALSQYYTATHDVEWLGRVGFPTMYGIASFYASRFRFSEKYQEYVIDDVIPPDEYAAGVNNSIFTNYLAAFSINVTLHLAEYLNLPCPSEWADIVHRVRLPMSHNGQYHLEYDGYANQTVKQADVILLGFPLQYWMSDDIRRNDLDLYENVTDPNGPAMTWAMFAVGYLELGEKAKGDELFERSFLNIHPPFNVWAETPSGDGAVNFITGAGGFLQGVLNGYGGLRLNPLTDDLSFCPLLPPDADSVRIRGIFYRGYRILVSYNATSLEVLLLPSSIPDKSCPGILLEDEGAGIFYFLSDDPLTFVLLSSDVCQSYRFVCAGAWSV